MRTMSNECEMKVMMVQRLDVHMKSAIEENLFNDRQVGKEEGGEVKIFANCRVGARV